MGKEGMQPSSSTELTVNGTVIKCELSGGRIIPSVGFLGPRGTYTESAKEALLGTNRAKVNEEPLSVRNRTVVEKVAGGEFDLGVVAGENSTEGEVAETFKALKRANLRILGETIVPIHHMLIGNPGYDITEVRSHPQALEQCNDFLERNYPKARRVEVFSTAEAALEVKRAKHIAAIAGKKVAEMNDLQILEEDIGDNPKNATTFFLIGRGETQPTGNDNTMLTFIPKVERAGALEECLKAFTDREINLTKIGSHPSPHGEINQYLFLTYLNGHEKDSEVADAIAALREYADVKILGSYQKAKTPEGATAPGTWNGN